MASKLFLFFSSLDPSLICPDQKAPCYMRGKGEKVFLPVFFFFGKTASGSKKTFLPSLISHGGRGRGNPKKSADHFIFLPEVP